MMVMQENCDWKWKGIPSIGNRHRTSFAVTHTKYVHVTMNVLYIYIYVYNVYCTICYNIILTNTTAGDTITSMHYSEGPEMSSGYLAVGLGNGDVDVIVRKNRQYTQTLTFSHDQPKLEVHM